MPLTYWLLWSVILIAQNFAFTFVSRARNSGSVTRHAVASIFSNGIWFTSQLMIFKVMYEMLVGHNGRKLQILAAAFYTSFTVLGALVGHFISLRTEKGKSAVGANKKYAQVPVEHYYALRDIIGERRMRADGRLAKLAEIPVEEWNTIRQTVLDLEKFGVRKGVEEHTPFVPYSACNIWPTPPISSSREGGELVSTS